MEERRRHVVLLFASEREGFQGREHALKELAGRREPVFFAKRHQALQPKLLAARVRGIGQPIRAKKHGIARRQSDGRTFIARGGK